MVPANVDSRLGGTLGAERGRVSGKVWPNGLLALFVILGGRMKWQRSGEGVSGNNDVWELIREGGVILLESTL